MKDWKAEKKLYTKKRKYRLWLVGNPDELGYHLPDDKRWLPATTLAYSMLIESLPKNEPFTGACLKWINNTLYYAEFFPMGVHTTKAFEKFYDMANNGELEKIKKNHIYNEDFRIPELGTEARIIWDRALASYVAEWEKKKKLITEVNQHLKAINVLLSPYR